MFGRKNKREKKQRQQAEAFLAMQAGRVDSIAKLKTRYEEALREPNRVARLITLEDIKKDSLAVYDDILAIDVDAKGLAGGTILGAIAGGTAAALLITNPLLVGLSACMWGVFGGVGGLVAAIPYDLNRMNKQLRKLQKENADFLSQLDLLVKNIDAAQADIITSSSDITLKSSPLFTKAMQNVPLLKERFDPAAKKSKKSGKNSRKPEGPAA